MKGFSFFAAVAVLVSACSPLATVKNVTPVPPSVTAPTESSLASEKEADSNPEAALSCDLDVAAKTWAELKRNPQDSQAIQLYNYSVARVVSLVQATGKLSHAGAVTIGTEPNSYLLTFDSDIKFVSDPRNCHLIPADEIAIAGKDYANRVRRNGIGAPLLVQSDAPVEKARDVFLPPNRVYYGMTAVLEFRARRFDWSSRIRLHPTGFSLPGGVIPWQRTSQ